MFSENEKYEYVCPQTLNIVRCSMAGWGQVVQAQPKDAFLVNLVR